MSLLRENIHLATIAPDAAEQAQLHGLGLEMDEFCTAVNLDEEFSTWDPVARERLAHVNRAILHAPFAELFPCAIDPLVRAVARKRFEQAASLCRSYGIRRMVVHSGFIPNVYFPVWFVEQGAQFFRGFLAAQPSDFEIMIENVLDPEPQPLLELVQAIGDRRAGACLDVGHANAVSKVPVTEWLTVLSPVLTHLHLHDNDGSWDTHSLPGDGTIGFPELFDHLPATATVTFECLDAAACVRRLQQFGVL